MLKENAHYEKTMLGFFWGGEATKLNISIPFFQELFEALISPWEENHCQPRNTALFLPNIIKITACILFLRSIFFFFSSKDCNLRFYSAYSPIEKVTHILVKDF